jgi:C-terminal processing protease CtpA/Prc
VFYYGASITEADLILPDGKSLERNGVTPDLTILPSADDLSNDRDPAMARAAALAGIELSAADAGKFFPYEWPSN